jgi:hypothetical protein
MRPEQFVTSIIPLGLRQVLPDHCSNTRDNSSRIDSMG